MAAVHVAPTHDHHTAGLIDASAAGMHHMLAAVGMAMAPSCRDPRWLPCVAPAPRAERAVLRTRLAVVGNPQLAGGAHRLGGAPADGSVVHVDAVPAGIRWTPSWAMATVGKVFAHLA